MVRGRYAILYIELIYAFEGLSKTFEKTFLTNRRFTKISSTLDLFTLKKGKYGFIHTIELNEREDINSDYVSLNTSAISNEMFSNKKSYQFYEIKSCSITYQILKTIFLNLFVTISSIDIYESKYISKIDCKILCGLS